MKRFALITMTLSAVLAGCNTPDLLPRDDGKSQTLQKQKVADARGAFYRNLAERKLARGNLRDAYRLSKDSHEMLEGNIDATMLFARTCIELGRVKEAMDALKPIVAENPDNNSAIYLYGVCYESAGEYEKALNLFQMVARREPDSVDAAIAMAETLVTLNRTEEAQKVVAKVMPLAGNHIGAWEVNGRIAQALGKYDKAVANYRQCLAMAPKNPTYVQLLADTLWLDGNKNEAESFYRRYIRLVGKQTPVSVFRRLAVYYVEVGKVALARQAHEAAIQAEPTNLNHVLALGRMECTLREYDRAVACCDKVLRAKPYSEQAFILKAYAQIAGRKPADAVETLLLAQKSNPKLTMIYAMLGRAYSDLGDNEKARKCFEYVALAEPKNRIAQRYLQYLRPNAPALATTASRSE